MALKASQLKVGDTHSERVVENLSRTQLVMYAGASGDYNPLHSDEVYSVQAAGYKSVFAHGMLSMGYLGEFLVQAGGADAIRKFRTRFAKLTWPGETITCRGRITRVTDEGGARLVECDIWTENQDGERKITSSATLTLSR